MRVTTFFRRIQIPFDARRLPVRAPSYANGDDLDGRRGEDGHLPVLEHDLVAREREQGRDVAREQLLANALPDDERGAPPCRIQTAGILSGKHGDRERAAHALQCAAHGAFQPVAVQLVLDEVGEHLSICLRLEPVTTAGEHLLQLAVVFDDSIVHDGQAPLAVEVRMGVALARASVSGPPRVTDSGARTAARLQEHRGQVGDPALGLFRHHLLLDEECCPCTVIAAVLEAAEAFHEERRGVARADVADDPAHAPPPCECRFAVPGSSDASRRNLFPVESRLKPENRAVRPGGITAGAIGENPYAGSGLEQSVADRVANETGSPVEIQLLHDPCAVGVGGLPADPQQGGDVLAGLPFGDELQNLSFAGRERVGLQRRFRQICLDDRAGDPRAQVDAAAQHFADGLHQIIGHLVFQDVPLHSSAQRLGDILILVVAREEDHLRLGAALL